MRIAEEEYTLELGSEVEGMLLDHIDEVNQLRLPRKIDHIAYIRASNRGDLFILTVRKDGELVGYLGFSITDDTNYEARIAREMGLYIKKEHRGGRTAIKLIKKAEEILKERGVDAILLMTSKEKDVGSLFEYMDYREVETSYVKEL